jgi:hypothetical protein
LEGKGGAGSSPTWTPYPKTAAHGQQFKTSSVHPLFKKSNLDKENLNNYRCVSQLSFLSKLTEKIVQTRLMHHLSSHNLLNPLQSAHIKFHSTETASLSLSMITSLKLWVSNKSLASLPSCFLDLSAAFDVQLSTQSYLNASHLGLIALDRTVLSWIASYLTNRYFHVSLNNFKSSSFPLQVGVPQESVLGPLLFIL